MLLLIPPFPSLPPSLPQVANTYTLWEECLALIDMCHTEDGRGMQDRVQSFWRCIIFNELPANARSPQLKVRLPPPPSLPPSLPRFYNLLSSPFHQFLTLSSLPPSLSPLLPSSPGSSVNPVTSSPGGGPQAELDVAWAWEERTASLTRRMIR